MHDLADISARILVLHLVLDDSKSLDLVRRKVGLLCRLHFFQQLLHFRVEDAAWAEVVMLVLLSEFMIQALHLFLNLSCTEL